MAPQKAALPLVGASYYAAVDEELRDFTRVQRHGQEDDLREALSRVIGRVQELCTLLKASCQTKTDLETQLAIAQSNLKMSIANNEMLEDALKRNAASKDVGWRRAPMSSSQRTSVDDTARPLDVGAAGSGSGDGNGNGEHAPPTPSTSQSTAAIPPPQNPPSGSTSAAANTQDGRFFRFRFSSGRTTPGQSPTSPPGTARPSLSGPSGHLTSASLPSLVQPLEEAHAKELEEFRTRLEEESKKLAKAVNEKIALEGELETLSQALFEEANKMVASERIKRAEAEEELKEALQEKEALRAAMKLMEHERTSRSAPALPPESAATAVASIRSRSSSVGAITSPIEDRESASPPVRGGNEAQRADSPDDGNGRGIPALYAIPDRASSFQARYQISVNMDARTPELASDASTPAADSSSASSIEPSPWNQERTHAIPSHTSFASPSPDEQDSPWR